MTLSRLGRWSGRLAILTALAGCVAMPVEGRPPDEALKSIEEPLSKQVTTEFLDTPLQRVLEYFQRETGRARQDRIDQITGLIQDTVGQQEDWAVYGGALNSIRELNGNLFIRATPPEHAQIRPRRGR